MCCEAASNPNTTLMSPSAPCYGPTRAPARHKLCAGSQGSIQIFLCPPPHPYYRLCARAARAASRCSLCPCPAPIRGCVGWQPGQLLSSLSAPRPVPHCRWCVRAARTASRSSSGRSRLGACWTRWRRTRGRWWRCSSAPTRRCWRPLPGTSEWLPPGRAPLGAGYWILGPLLWTSSSWWWW